MTSPDLEGIQQKNLSVPVIEGDYHFMYVKVLASLLKQWNIGIHDFTY